MTFSKPLPLKLKYTTASGGDGSVKTYKYATNIKETTSESGGKDFESELYRCPEDGSSCTLDSATLIGTRNKTGALVFNNNENDENIYMLASNTEDGAFKISKAGMYYYMNLKNVFDKRGLDYKNKSYIYDIKKEKNENVEYFVLTKRKK